MSSVIKDLYLHKKTVESLHGTAPFGTLVFRETSDNPNPALKRLTILFLALEGKGLLFLALEGKGLPGS